MVCYQKGKERGLFFELKCVSETIAILESLGKDASHEKTILKYLETKTQQDYELSSKLQS